MIKLMAEVFLKLARAGSQISAAALLGSSAVGLILEAMALKLAAQGAVIAVILGVIHLYSDFLLENTSNSNERGKQ